MKLKELLVVVVLGLLMTGVLFLASARFEKIDNGEMILVSQSNME